MRSKTITASSRARLEQLEEFIAAHGRLPTSARSAPETERRLAAWTERVRRTADARTWLLIDDLIQRARPQRQTPGTAKPPRDTALRAFITDHRRLPRVGSREPDEAALARWTRRIVRRGALEAELLAMVTQHGGYGGPRPQKRPAPAPTPRGSAPGASATDRRVAELADFCATHHRLPSARLRGEHKERSLALWLRRHLAGGAVHSRVHELASAYPTAAELARHSPRSTLYAFIVEHRNLPSPTAPTFWERLLGAWALKEYARYDGDPVVRRMVEDAGGYRLQHPMIRPVGAPLPGPGSASVA